MKIGDKVYIRGYVDEIRKDTVIIHNYGGYFGTAASEIIEPERTCSTCRYNANEWDEEPCDSCTSGGSGNHWKPTIELGREINNKVNLCDSCKYTFPDCSSKESDMIFGNGIGDDNICACAKYVPAGRKRGKWIVTGDGLLVYCSECEDSYYERNIGASWRYCPYCGAQMERGEQE